MYLNLCSFYFKLCSNPGTKRDTMGLISSVKMMFTETKQVIQIRTFQVIIAQGVAGSFPWAAMAFAPMWLETMGFSHVITALLVGVFVVAGCLEDVWVTF